MAGHIAMATDYDDLLVLSEEDGSEEIQVSIDFLDDVSELSSNANQLLAKARTP